MEAYSELIESCQARFMIFAGVFFQIDVPYLDETQLCPPENCTHISMSWMDRLDKGCLIFKYMGGEVGWQSHPNYPPVTENIFSFMLSLFVKDSHRLEEERGLKGVCGPTLLQLYEGSRPRFYSRPNPILIWIHQFLVSTWHVIGLLGASRRALF